MPKVYFPKRNKSKNYHIYPQSAFSFLCAFFPGTLFISCYIFDHSLPIPKSKILLPVWFFPCLAQDMSCNVLRHSFTYAKMLYCPLLLPKCRLALPLNCFTLCPNSKTKGCSACIMETWTVDRFSIQHLFGFNYFGGRKYGCSFRRAFCLIVPSNVCRSLRWEGLSTDNWLLCGNTHQTDRRMQLPGASSFLIFSFFSSIFVFNSRNGSALSYPFDFLPLSVCLCFHVGP